MTIIQQSETMLEVDGDDALVIQAELDAAVALASSAC